jgi:ERCC4-type nuclease
MFNVRNLINNIRNRFQKQEHELRCQWCNEIIYVNEEIEVYETGKVFEDDVVECIVVHKHCKSHLPTLIKMLEEKNND